MLKRNDIQVDRKLKLCIECKKEIARYWSNHLCEDCFRKYLSMKVNDEK
jgi:hypothetical protein